MGSQSSRGGFPPAAGAAYGLRQQQIPLCGTAYKEDIRRDIRQQRRLLAPEAKSRMDERIYHNLLRLVNHFQPEVLYAYASVRQEADTWQFMKKMWEMKKPIALPRIEGEQICFYYVTGRQDLQAGPMGILEPAEGKCIPAAQAAALVITPGLAFSPDGDRIGYGSGYYDRFFAREPYHTSVAVAYPFQIRQDIQPENCDQKIHYLLTPERVISCQTGDTIPF